MCFERNARRLCSGRVFRPLGAPSVRFDTWTITCVSNSINSPIQIQKNNSPSTNARCTCSLLSQCVFCTDRFSSDQGNKPTLPASTLLFSILQSLLCSEGWGLVQSVRLLTNVLRLSCCATQWESVCSQYQTQVTLPTGSVWPCLATGILIVSALLMKKIKVRNCQIWLCQNGYEERTSACHECRKKMQVLVTSLLSGYLVVERAGRENSSQAPGTRRGCLMD